MPEERGIASLGSRRQQEMVPVDPSLRDRMHMYLSDTFGHSPRGRRRTDMFMKAAEWVPGVDESLLFSDAREEAEQGNYITSGLLGGAGLLSILPFVPPGAGKPIKKGTRSLKEGLASLKRNIDINMERRKRGEVEWTPPTIAEARRLKRGEKGGTWGGRKENFRPDAAALKESATRQGYETDRVLYHGARKPWVNEDPMFRFTRGGDSGPYLTERPRIANNYSADPGGNTIPVYVKGPGLKLTRAGKRAEPFGPEFRQEAAEQLDISLENMSRSDQVDAIMDAARKQGYGYVEMKGVIDVGGQQAQVIPLGGDKVRSVWAQFDPGLADDATSLSHASGGLVTLPQQFDAGGGVFGDDDWGGPADTGYNMNSLLGGTLGQSKGMNLFANTFNTALAVDAANQGIGASHSTDYDPSSWALGMAQTPVYTGDLSVIKSPDPWGHYVGISPDDFNDDDLLELYGLAKGKLNEWRSGRPEALPYPGNAGEINAHFEEMAVRDNYLQSVKDAINSRGLDMPTGTFAQNVSAIGRVVGGWFDKVFEFLGIAGPDYAVGQVEGGTLIWGEPQGDAVFSRIGTTPEGTIVGVQTGIPSLDRILSHTADVMTGRVEAGEIFNADTVAQLIIDAVTDEFGLEPGFVTVEGIGEAVAKIKSTLEGTNEDGSAVTMAQAVDNTIFDEDKTTNYDGTPTDEETQANVLSTPGGTQIGVGTTAVGAAVVGAIAAGDKDKKKGTDTIVTAGDGQDIVVVGDGQDTIVTAGDGQDTIVTAGDGQDTIVTAGDGQDIVVGGDGQDIVVVGDGQDTIVTAGDGQDIVVGGDGQDVTSIGSIDPNAANVVATTTTVDTPAAITLGGKLDEIVLGADVSQKEKVGGGQQRIDAGGNVNPDVQTGDEISAVNVGGDVLGSDVGGDVLGSDVGGDVFGSDVGGDVFGSDVGGDVLGSDVGGNVFGFTGVGGDVFGSDVGGDVSGDRIGGALSFTGAGGEYSNVGAGGATSGDRVGTDILNMGVGGKDYALGYGGAQTDQGYGGDRTDLVVGDRLYELATGGAERAVDLDEVTLGGATSSSDKTLKIGGDKVAAASDKLGWESPSSLGMGYRGMEAEPGDIMELDSIIGTPYSPHSYSDIVAYIKANRRKAEEGTNI